MKTIKEYFTLCKELTLPVENMSAESISLVLISSLVLQINDAVEELKLLVKEKK